MAEVIVGRIGRPHGTRGEVSVEVRTDEPERRFAVGTTLAAEDGTGRFRVDRVGWHQGRLLVKFEQLTDRTAAEQARGTLLVLDVADDETPDEPNAYYDRQLVGLTVLSAQNVPVGRITQVVHLPGHDLLEVATDDGARLIPFVTDVVPIVDLASGQVQLADLPGLLADLD